MASMDAFLKALVANDSSTLPLSPHLKATENAEPSDLKSGLWQKATKIGSYAFTCSDKTTDQHGFAGLIWRGNEGSIVSIRIKINSSGEIEESEIIVGIDRFPGEQGTDPRTLTTWREDFAKPIPKKRQQSREELKAIATSYYDAVTTSTPSKVPLSHEGNRVENGARITNNPEFSLVDGFYESGEPGLTLPNFGEWSPKEQFDRGLWNSDTVVGERFPLIDPEQGVVMAYALYQPWMKANLTDVQGVGKITRLGGPERNMVSLCMMELFKIKDGMIFDMESVWFIGPLPMSSGW
jgi:hypothetical protein